MSITVLLADDHRLVREGLRSLLEQETDLEVVAEASNGRDAVRLARQLSPDVALVDISMPDMNGIEATRQILSEGSGARVIALSMHSHRRFIEEMLRAGASGYLLKECAIKDLVDAIRAVVAGGTYLSPAIASVVAEGFVSRSPSKPRSAFSVLSRREREVLQLLAEGCNSKGVARKLGVSPSTIRVHRKNIKDKLRIDNMPELTKYAIREGLTFLDA